MKIENKSNEELTKDYIECVKLNWRFHGLYNMTIAKLRSEFQRRGLNIPKVENPLEYLG